MLETNLLLSGLDLHDQHEDMRLDIDNMSYEVCFEHVCSIIVRIKYPWAWGKLMLSSLICNLPLF